MKIAVIDDKPDELEKAKKAVESAGHEAVAFLAGDTSLRTWIGQIVDTADAVITDLMFRSNSYQPEREKIPPAGILVVIHALSKGKPAVICTDVFADGGSYGHHGQTIGWIYDGYVSGFNNDMKTPFGWKEKKRWDQAVRQLESKIQDGDYNMWGC